MNHERAGLLPGVRWLGSALLLLFAATAAALAQSPAPADSSRPDTILVAVPDSVRTLTPRELEPVGPVFPGLTPFGSVLYTPRARGELVISELEVAWSRYATVFDVLQPRLNALPLTQGSAGLVRGFSVAGASPRAVSYLSNGRALVGVAGYGYDAELYPLEFAERVEVLSGPRALVYGQGEALRAVNFVQPRFDVEASYARLWYTQEAGDLSGVDVMFARNVGRRSSVTVGVRRLATSSDENARLENQAVSDWTIHAAASWRPTRAWMIALTDIYADGTRGQNGGLDPTSAFDLLNESVVQPFWSERRIQHDLTLAAEWVNPRGMLERSDSVPRATAADSATRAGAALYYAVSRRQIEAFDSIVAVEAGGLREDLERLGVRAFARAAVGDLVLEGNAVAELRSLSTWRATTTDDGYRQAGIGASLPLGPVELVLATRYSDGMEGRMLAAAGEAWIGRGSPVGARVGARIAANDCPCDIVDLGDTVVLDAFRTTALAEASTWVRDEVRSVEAAATLRRAESVRSAGGTMEVATIDVAGQTPIWLLGLDVRATGVLGLNDNRFAQWSLSTDLFMPLRLFQGNLDLRVGTALEMRSGLTGVEYEAATGAFIAPDPAREPVRQWPGWSVYAHARFGTAYVRLAMRNLLDVERWTVYRYPERGRSFVLAVTWSFID